jgi:hypothetical protein
MIHGNWIALHKGLITALPDDRSYTELEAMFSLSVDIDNNRTVNISGYSKLWGWSRKKVRNFFNTIGVEISYPQSTQKKQNQNGKIKGVRKDRLEIDQEQIRYIINRDMYDMESKSKQIDNKQIDQRGQIGDRSGTDRGQIGDRSGTDQGQIGDNKINTSEMLGDRSGTDQGQIRDRSGTEQEQIGDSTIYPNPNPNPKIRKSSLKKNSKKSIMDNQIMFDRNSNEFRLSLFLENYILKNNPQFKKKNLQSWSKDFDLLLRVDNRDIEEVKAMIKWCQEDSFWKSNILSASKLRKQYDRLKMTMNEKKIKKSNHKSIYDIAEELKNKKENNTIEVNEYEIT